MNQVEVQPLLPGVIPAAPHIVGREQCVRDALQVINSTPTKMAVLVDEAGVLVRTVTDGDIRRGLLAGLELLSPLDRLPGRSPVTCHSTAGLDTIKELLDRNDVASILMVDSDGRPVAIAAQSGAGGTIHMSPPHIGSAELDFVRAAFEDNWVAPAGPNLDRFERQLAVVAGRAEAAAVSSGTAALHLALRVLGVRAGDRVYVSDLTFIASLQPVLYEHAIPVLIDSEPRSWNMSPAALARKLAQDATLGQLPKAIILVHLYGQPAELAEIMAVADHYGVPVVEDAAESLGASYGNRPSGAHGLLSAYSFNGNKIITTSGGGALVGDDPALMAHARKLATQGREPIEHYQHAEVAYNYRMSNVLAGIGIGQLELLDARVAARRAIFDRYRAGLGDLPGIGMQHEAADSTGNRWLSVITLDPDLIELHPFQLMRELRGRGIECRPGWKPMHMQPLCAGYEFVPHNDGAPVSPRLFFQSLCLPSGSSLDEVQQGRIVERIRKIILEN